MTDEMDEIWALYADDGAQALDAMETTLTELEEDAPEDAKAQIGALFRAVHTFKGNSRVLGLVNVERVAHLAEDLIGLVRDEGVPLTPEILELLIRTGDMLRGMLEETADTRADVDPGPSEGLKANLQELIDRLTGKEPEAAQDAAEPEESAAEPAAEPVAEAEEATEDDDTPAEPVAETAPEAEETPEPEDAPEDEAPSKAAAFDPGLAGLLDQLDGGSDFDDSFFDDESEDAGAADSAEAPAEDEEEDDTPSAPAVATVAEVTEGKLQTIDPMYQKIFADMATEAIGKLAALMDDWSDADSPAAAHKAADGLWYAAGQMSLSDWVAPMQAYLDAGTHDKDATAHLLEELRTLYKENVSSEDSSESPDADPSDSTDIASMFKALAEFYPELAEQGMAMRSDSPREDAARRDLSSRIRSLFEPFEFIRLLDAVDDLATATAGSAYQAAELCFYEELLAVERTAPKDTFSQELVAPSKILGAWCSDHVFETLQALRQGLDDRSRSGNEWFPEFETLMRQVHHACLNFKIDTASQLTMSLIDLFSRIRIENQTPDVILLQMGRGYVDTMELVFDALDQGDTPDTSRIEQMFEEASNVCFVASGVVTAKSIEARLGLPPEFHRVMSPESAKNAHIAIEDGLHFYVLRADINDDDALAQGFFEWITSGIVQMITNVTVFLDNATMFDFLVASSLEEDRMMERLTALDPSGRKLSMVRALEVKDAVETEAPDSDGMEISFGGDASDSLALLEAVGAISAKRHHIAVKAVLDMGMVLGQRNGPALIERLRIRPGKFRANTPAVEGAGGADPQNMPDLVHGDGQEIILFGSGLAETDIPAGIKIKADDPGPGFEIAHRAGAAEIGADPRGERVTRSTAAIRPGQRQDGPVKGIGADEDDKIIDRIGQRDGLGSRSGRIAQVERQTGGKIVELVLDDGFPLRRRLFENNAAQRIVEKSVPVKAIVECDREGQVSLSFCAAGKSTSSQQGPGIRMR